MLLGTGDSHFQLDCKALTDIEGFGAARQGIAYFQTEGTKKSQIFPFQYSHSIKSHTQLASSVPLWHPCSSPGCPGHPCKQTRVIASVVQ